MSNIYVRKTGNNNNDGSSPASAVLTLEKAVALINIANSSYNTLIIGAGRYSFGSRYNIIKKDNIKIIGDTTGRYTGDSGKVVIIDSSPEMHGFQTHTCKHLYWENIMITNGHPSHYVFSNHNDTWIFKNCVMSLEGESTSPSHSGYSYCSGIDIPATFINCTIIGSYANYVNYKKVVNCMIYHHYNNSRTNEIHCFRYSPSTSNGNLRTKDIFNDVTSHDYSLKEAFVGKVMNQGITPEEDPDVPNVDMMGRGWGGKPWIGAFISFQAGYLYVKNNEAYGMNNGVFTKLADSWSTLATAEKKALFESTNYETASTEDLVPLGKFKVLTYSKMGSKPEITVIAAPKDQLTLPKGFISVEKFDGIDKTTLTDTVSGGGVCKIIVTTDLKVYQTYDFETQKWKSIDHTDLAAVKSSGIDAAQLAAISRSAWNALLKGKAGLGFAYLIGIEATSDQCAVDKLAVQVDMEGAWAK